MIDLISFLASASRKFSRCEPKVFAARDLLRNSCGWSSVLRWLLLDDLITALQLASLARAFRWMKTSSTPPIFLRRSRFIVTRVENPVGMWCTGGAGHCGSVPRLGSINHVTRAVLEHAIAFLRKVAERT